MYAEVVVYSSYGRYMYVEAVSTPPTKRAYVQDPSKSKL